MRSFGSYAHPWDEIGEQQRTTRCDRVLDQPSRYVYNAERDCYRSKDAQENSPDWAPAGAVEERRKTRDGERTDVESFRLCPSCRDCGGDLWLLPEEDDLPAVYVCGGCSELFDIGDVPA
jgi:hypothetical protein